MTEGKPREFKHVEQDYSTPEATWKLELAMRAEEKGNEKFMDKFLEKAAALEAEGK